MLASFLFRLSFPEGDRAALVSIPRSVEMLGLEPSLLSGARVLLESHLVDDLALLLLGDAVALVFLGSFLGLDPARSGFVGQVDVHCGV